MQVDIDTVVMMSLVYFISSWDTCFDFNPLLFMYKVLTIYFIATNTDILNLTLNNVLSVTPTS